MGDSSIPGLVWFFYVGASVFSISAVWYSMVARTEHRSAKAHWRACYAFLDEANECLRRAVEHHQKASEEYARVQGEIDAYNLRADKHNGDVKHLDTVARAMYDAFSTLRPIPDAPPGWYEIDQERLDRAEGVVAGWRYVHAKQQEGA